MYVVFPCGEYFQVECAIEDIVLRDKTNWSAVDIVFPCGGVDL